MTRALEPMRGAPGALSPLGAMVAWECPFGCQKRPWGG